MTDNILKRLTMSNSYFDTRHGYTENMKINTHISVLILQTLTCCYQYCLELSEKNFQTQKCERTYTIIYGLTVSDN